MINRYSSPQMTAIFSDQGRYDRWRDVELAVLAAYAATGQVDESVFTQAEAVPTPTPGEVAEREKTVGHDVVAFLVEWTSTMPAPVASAVHRGLTSSDVVDTAQALQLKAASELLLTSADRLIATLVEHGLAHRASTRIGRTHGQHASLDVWGHRVADVAFAADRARRQLADSTAQVAVGKLSGPTGAYHHIPVEVEAHACARLGLTPVEVATQVVMRDRLAGWMFALARLATVCEAFALEVRLSQRPEVGELFEGAGAARAGSSSMPHKANPITSENICGLAKMVRAYVNPVLEGAALWHERDLTHSSVERVAIPDAAALTERIVNNTVTVISELVVDHDRMAATANAATTASASNSVLVALGDLGVPWNTAREIVHAASRRAEPGVDDAFADQLRAELHTRHPELSPAWAEHASDVAPPQLDSVFAALEHLAGNSDNPSS